MCIVTVDFQEEKARILWCYVTVFFSYNSRLFFFVGKGLVGRLYFLCVHVLLWFVGFFVGVLLFCLIFVWLGYLGLEIVD